MMDRRHFLKAAGLGTALSLLPIGLRGWAASASPLRLADSQALQRHKRLIVVFLRGAVDGLNVVVPYTEPNYYAVRQRIAVARPGQDGGALDLDGRFGLHPSLAPLLPLWKAGSLAFVHACGSTDPSRSHFDAQDFMESGTPGDKHTRDGWMNRLLGVLPGSHAAMQGISLGETVPRILTGPQAVANVALGRNWGKVMPLDRPRVSKAFDRMYGGDDALSKAFRQAQASRATLLDEMDQIDEERKADNGAPPPAGFAQDTDQLAHLIAIDPSVQLAFLALGGWDTHVNEGAGRGQLANRLTPLANGLASLVRGLGKAFDDTMIVVMSEFGRTVHENGNGGTDHGHGNVMWLLGGGLKGGKVYGQWPGLEEAQLYQGRDLAVTTDFRRVLANVLEQHWRLSPSQVATVLPGELPANGLGDLLKPSYA